MGTFKFYTISLSVIIFSFISLGVSGQSWEVTFPEKVTTLIKVNDASFSKSSCVRQITFEITLKHEDADDFWLYYKTKETGGLKGEVHYTTLDDSIHIAREMSFQIDSTIKKSIFFEVINTPDSVSRSYLSLLIQTDSSSKVNIPDKELIIKVTSSDDNSCTNTETLSSNPKNSIFEYSQDNKIHIGTLKFNTNPLTVYSYAEKFCEENNDVSTRKAIDSDKESSSCSNSKVQKLNMVKKGSPYIRLGKRKAFLGERNPDKPLAYQLIIKDTNRYKIASASVTIKDGLIKNLQINTTEGIVFENVSSPVSITNYYRQTNNEIYLKALNNHGKRLFINLREVLDYIYTGGQRIFPDDNTFTFPDSTGNFQRRVQLDTNIDRQVNASVYSDLLGLSDEANGLIQTDISTKFILNTQNVNRSWFVWAPSIEPYLSISKFDSGVDSLKKADVDSPRTVDRLKLFQLADANIGMKLTLLKYDKIHQFYMNLGLDWYRVSNFNTNDTTSNESVNLTSYYGEIGFQVNRSENFGILLNGHVSLNRIWRNSDLKKRGFVLIFNPSATVYWNPVKNQSGRAFVRFSPYFSGKSDANETFLKVQLGYKVDFTSLFNEN
jgi:hypothetical protein